MLNAWTNFNLVYLNVNKNLFWKKKMCPYKSCERTMTPFPYVGFFLLFNFLRQYFMSWFFGNDFCIWWSQNFLFAKYGEGISCLEKSAFEILLFIWPLEHRPSELEENTKLSHLRVYPNSKTLITLDIY